MNFRCQIGPLSECFMFCLISDWKSHWTDGFLKDFNRFIFQFYLPPLKHTHPTHTPTPHPTFLIVPKFSKFLPPTRNFTLSTLTMYLNIIYQRTIFALKIWSRYIKSWIKIRHHHIIFTIYIYFLFILHYLGAFHRTMYRISLSSIFVFAKISSIILFKTIVLL